MEKSRIGTFFDYVKTFFAEMTSSDIIDREPEDSVKSYGNDEEIKAYNEMNKKIGALESSLYKAENVKKVAGIKVNKGVQSNDVSVDTKQKAAEQIEDIEIDR